MNALNVNYLIIYVLAELIGCDLCNYHGTCYLSNQDETICECFQWYAGKHCQFNLKGKFFNHLTNFILLARNTVQYNNIFSFIIGTDCHWSDVTIASCCMSVNGLL